MIIVQFILALSISYKLGLKPQLFSAPFLNLYPTLIISRFPSDPQLKLRVPN
jgi:hypothetical protein